MDADYGPCLPLPLFIMNYLYFPFPGRKIFFIKKYGQRDFGGGAPIALKPEGIFVKQDNPNCIRMIDFHGQLLRGMPDPEPGNH